MKRVERLKNEQLYIKLANIIRVGNRAIKKAKEENKAFGIPETFCKGGGLNEFTFLTILKLI